MIYDPLSLIKKEDEEKKINMIDQMEKVEEADLIDGNGEEPTEDQIVAKLQANMLAGENE